MKLEEANTYAIVGTGAVGGFYGAHLAHAGFEVHFLLRSQYEHVRRHGLHLKSPDGDIALPHVNAYNDATAMPRVDVVVVAVKATGNDALPAILPHVVKPGGLVVLLQNGLGCEETIASAAAPAQIVGGLAFLCSTVIGPGLIRHQAYSRIDVAPWTPDGRAHAPGAALEQMAADLRQAGIPVRVLDNLALARWQKLMWNIPFSGLCVALDSDTLRIVNDPDALAMARALMRDVAASAAACGQRIDDDFLQRMVDETVVMPAYRPSLKVDFDAGASLELEAIFGNPARAAQRAGHPAPLIEHLYRHLRWLDRARSRRG